MSPLRTSFSRACRACRASTASTSSWKSRWRSRWPTATPLSRRSSATRCISIVGHTHAFDPAVRLMRDIIARGELGKLGLIHSFNYTNFSIGRAGRKNSTPRRAAASCSTRCRTRSILRGCWPAACCGVCARARRCSILRGRPRQAAPRCCNSTTAPRRHWSTAATTISIPTSGTSASPSAAAEADRAWRRPPLAGQGHRRSESAHRDLRLWRGQGRSAAAPAAFRRHHRDLCRRRHARLR